MAPTLPSSLSPHICILSSPDLSELLSSSSLPPLPQILQSFSPLSQVTTRTINLQSIPHTSFALRFSDLNEIETACKEDEEQRAGRTIDWIGARVNNRCAKWVDGLEKMDGRDGLRTPWWEELKRCVEGDHVPSKVEGWNHPVSIILAVSTTAPNPLQAITNLHSRTPDFPSWVDPAHIRCTLIVHPQNSSLSDEEAGALFNAVKKQFGMHTYLIPLALPSPPPAPVPVPAVVPRLPPPSLDSPEISFGVPQTPNGQNDGASSPGPAPINTLRLCQQDIQQTAKFTREFVMMSLLPWMEKCILEWNENYASTRRLPSRLFSSTRRLFGTAAPPAHSSMPSLPSRSHTYSGSQSSISGVSGIIGPPSQQRRLAEFATILGDFKLAVNVWESLRKEGKGGSEILPLLLTPAPTIPLHVSHALSTIHPPTPEPPALTQLRALVYAVRWEIGIGGADFLGDILEGERWLVWAAGNSEESPSALLLAHAALLSSRKAARRRAALWYLSAANRLEKCGIKPLTMYFLRRAHEMCKLKEDKELSPSFWASEGKTPGDIDGFDVVLQSIEHPLGRLLYNTGDLVGAIRLFLGLLRGTSRPSSNSPVQPILLPAAKGQANGTVKPPNSDKTFLEDFRSAFQHFKSTAGDDSELSDLQLPFNFCLVRQTAVRLPRDNIDKEKSEWAKRESAWSAFWKTRGKEDLEKSGKAAVEETFWIDLVLCNPLDTEVNFSDLTVLAEEATILDAESSKSFIEVETLQEVVLGPRETRTVPIGIKVSRPASLKITHISYKFLSLLPLTESLGSRGRRLQETALHRQNVMYAPDIWIKVEVEEAAQKLLVGFADNDELTLAQGERKRLKLWFANKGSRDIGEIWLVAGPEDEFWIDDGEQESSYSPDTTEILHSSNSIAPQQPHRISFEESILQPGDSREISLVFRAEQVANYDFRLLFVHREKDGDPFHSVRITRHIRVQPLLRISTSSQPSRSLDHLFFINLVIEHVAPSDVVQITQVTTISPTWKCTALADHALKPISSRQTNRIFLGANIWENGPKSEDTLSFVSRKLEDVIHGRVVEKSDPPPIDLVCSHVLKELHNHSVEHPPTRHFIHSGRRNIACRSVASCHPYIPSYTYPSIFPLYHPTAVDTLIFWEIPVQGRSGHLLASGIMLGAGHAALKETIEDAENAKVKRSMYAETQREKMEVLEAIRGSEWNMEMNPLIATMEEGEIISHDFSKGPRQVETSFILRNYSLTHTSRFLLKLPVGGANYPPSPDILPPHYSGKLTFRGTVKPLEVVTMHPKIWVHRPGTYTLGGWRLETEVGELLSTEAWRTRHRYVQEPPSDDTLSVTICAI